MTEARVRNLLTLVIGVAITSGVLYLAIIKNDQGATGALTLGLGGLMSWVLRGKIETPKG